MTATDGGSGSSWGSSWLSHEEIAVSRLRWLEERRWLSRYRSELAQLAVQLYPAEHRLPGTTLIAPPEWLMIEPVELGSLVLRLDEGPQTTAVDGSEPESAATRPLRTAGVRFERYTSAIKHLSPPALFESRPCYRLLDAAPASHRLEFGLASYFDKLDVCEALAHELAAVCLADGLAASPEKMSPQQMSPQQMSPRQMSPEKLRGRLPFRDLIGDPFNPQTRAINGGFATLTVRRRRYPAESSFLLHWRDPAKVATGGGVYSVIPEGEFQPASVALWDRRNDFDLWRTIVREYSEELLGEPEHDVTRNQPIDYEQWPLFQRLQTARTDGSVGVFFLGLGLSALTLAPSILTVAVIDDDVFTEIFGAMVRSNEEGEIVSVDGGAPTDGVPFTEAAVRRMLETEPMAETGAACLALAWQHRHTLGL